MRHDPTLRFLLVWLIAPLIALEILSNKPPLYTVQAVFPAGALLVALAIGRIEPYRRCLRALPGMFWGTAVLLAAIAPVLLWGLLWVTDTPLTPLLVVGFAALAGLFVYAGWVSAHGYGMAWFSTSMLATFILGLWFNGLLMPGLQNFLDGAANCGSVGATARMCRRPRLRQRFSRTKPGIGVGGRAHIGSPEAAAAGIAAADASSAIIESRQIDRFQKALALDKSVRRCAVSDASGHSISRAVVRCCSRSICGSIRPENGYRTIGAIWRFPTNARASMSCSAAG